MSRQEHIIDAIEQRKLFFTEVELMQVSLLQHWQSLQELEQLQAEIIQEGTSSANTQKSKPFNFSRLREKIEAEIQALEKPKARFSRPTLNIGVIGRAHQGKSRLLQSLSGLDTTIIPTGRRGRCSGVRRLICHNPGQKPHAEIVFYSEQEFLTTVITPLYLELGFFTLFASIEDFIHMPLPRLDINADAARLEKYLQIVDYQVNIDSYRALLNAPVRHIDLAEVSAYISLSSLDGLQKYYTYMAVKEARMICAFPLGDIGPVTLVDLPGPEDSVIQPEERLIHNLGEQIDAVLFVHMPSPIVPILSYVDVGLYDLMAHTLQDPPIERCSFMVLNHINTPLAQNNYLSCNHIYYLITTDNANMYGRNLQFTNTLIADCSNSEDVQNLVFKPVLDYLAKESDTLDRDYLAGWQKRLASLQKEVADELEKELCC